MLAVQADGRSVDTVESLAGAVTELSIRRRRPSTAISALQCGFRTPGMLMTLTELEAAGTPLDEEASPGRR